MNKLTLAITLACVSAGAHAQQLPAQQQQQLAPTLQPPSQRQQDPTELTTEALRREIDLLGSLIAARLVAVEKTQQAFEQNITRVPTDVDKQVGQLRDLLEMRFQVADANFANIDTQFRERDVRTDLAADSVGKAIDAALRAAQERADKTESALFKQLDQLSVLFDRQAAALQQQLGDVKERVIAMEQRSEGSIEQRSEGRDSQSLWAGIIFGLIGAAVGTGSLVFAITRSPKEHSAPSAQPQVITVQAPPAPSPTTTTTTKV